MDINKMVHIILWYVSFALCFLLTSQSNCLLKNDAVMFSAALATIKHIRSDEIVKYDLVYTNYGGGYNINTGVFTSPQDGVYFLAINGFARMGSHLWLSLYHNLNQVMSVYCKIDAIYPSASNSIILELKKNEQVYVKSRVDSIIYGLRDEIYMTFSGYRISFV